jgi:hypothetical protein
VFADVHVGRPVYQRRPSPTSALYSTFSHRSMLAGNQVPGDPMSFSLPAGSGASMPARQERRTGGRRVGQSVFLNHERHLKARVGPVERVRAGRERGGGVRCGMRRCARAVHPFRSRNSTWEIGSPAVCARPAQPARVPGQGMARASRRGSETAPGWGPDADKTPGLEGRVGVQEGSWDRSAGGIGRCPRAQRCLLRASRSRAAPPSADSPASTTDAAGLGARFIRLGCRPQVGGRLSL